MPYHCLRVKLARSPNTYAINIATKPASKNLNAEIDNGGATWTIIWAEVKALDHISAKVNPINVDLMSISAPMEKAALERRP